MFDPLDRQVYPADPWRLIETAPPADPTHAEAIFALGNGFVGVRGVREEDDPSSACFVNGFFETWPIKYPEDAYGLARVGQAIQPAPLPCQLTLTVDGCRLGRRASDGDGGQPVAQRRELDMTNGVLTRETTWATPSGPVLVRSRRLVSFTRRGLVVSVVEVIPSRPAGIVVQHTLASPPRPSASTGLDPRNGTVLEGPTVEVTMRAARADGCVVGVRTPRADQRLLCVLSHQLEADGGVGEREIAVGGAGTQVTWECPVGSVKLAVMASYALGDDDDALSQASSELDAAAALGWDGLVAEQTAWLDDFWAVADVEVRVGQAGGETHRAGDGDAALQQAIRWSIFQTIQACGRADGQGVAAKGVTGSGYDGHYFWDMEMYVLPLLTYTHPSAARAALGFRLATLPLALARAQELGLAGALFPWRTIDGREASAYFPAGTAQYHIDADIVHALAQYVAATGDESIMLDGCCEVGGGASGADLAIETARLWASLGFWGEDGQFHIHYVTGPDEYSALVDDNVYTNVMARANLRFAAGVASPDRLPPVTLSGGDGFQPARGAQAPSSPHGLGGPQVWAGGCGVASPDRLPPVTGSEIAEWRRMADGMCVPFDASRGVHPQDAGFLGRQPWDLASIPRENFPLLLHYHPLTIYRHQVLKQADVVLAQIICPGDFTPAQKRSNFDFYDPLTTGDSTLSAVPQAIAAAEVGQLDLAREYLERAAFVDLANSHGNTDAGVHVAVAAGVWNALVSGFGGLRDSSWGGGAGAGSGISLNPQLPKGWSSLTFHLLIRGVKLTVLVTADEVALTADGPLELTVWERPVEVGPGKPVTMRR